MSPKPITSVFILTDLEGVAGVTQFIQTREKGPANEKAKLLLTKEVNAAIKAIRALNPQIIIHIWDGHGPGGIIRSQLEIVEFFLPNKSFNMTEYFITHRIDALLFLGQHSMAGTPNGNLAHTMSSRSVEYYKLNNKLIGEFGIRAAIIGELGIPTIFISGDDKACEEALQMIPEIVTCPVKIGKGLESAESLPFESVYTLISQKITLALKKISAIPPPRIDALPNPPFYQLEIRNNKSHSRFWYFWKSRIKWLFRTSKKKKNSFIQLIDSKTYAYFGENLAHLERNWRN